jgi:hypothetical protein
MSKFEKLNPEKHLRGLVEAARRIQIEELSRDQDISFPYGANALSDKGATIPEKKPASRSKRRVN